MRKKWRYIFAFLWALFCLYLSVQPQTETSKLSMVIASTIAELMRVSISECNFFLRKAAHFVIFLILSLLSSLVSCNKKSLLICLGIASVIEIIKIPVADRHTEIGEIGLDFLGIIVGWVIAKIMYLIANCK